MRREREGGRAMERLHPAMVGAACLVLSLAYGLPVWAAEEGVEVQEVQIRMVDHSPVVLLIVGERFVPIFVDPTVAVSIASALSGGASPRPLSHDLIRLMLLEFGAKVTRTVITLKEKTYYADLTVILGGRTISSIVAPPTPSPWQCCSKPRSSSTRRLGTPPASP